MKKRLVAIIFTVIFVITGCSPKIQGENLMQGVEARTIDNDCVVGVSGEDVLDFAVRLLQANGVDEKNVLISPMSVLCALGMVANGADEETLIQMEKVLGIPVTMLNNYIYGYRKVLPQSEKCKLNLANSIWFTTDERFTVDHNFLQLNADYYGADMYTAAFDNSTLKDINNWVKQETDGMIPEILDKIPDEAVMYLINALAFEAEWANVYEKNQVREGTFITEKGKMQTVDFMYNEEDYYIEDTNAKGFLKYYKDSNYAFVALLPNEGMTVSDYVATLDGEHLNELLSNRQAESVRTSIPKFEAEYSIEMSNILSEMEMPNAFDEEKADFSKLGSFEKGNIYIGRMLHKTYISVDDRGTKAGAATIVEMVGKSSAMVEEQKTVYLNRPFVYMLVDCHTNVPFFIGTMMNVNE